MIVVYAIFNFLSLLFCILKSQLRELVLQNIDIDDRKSSECWDCGGCFIYMVCLLYSTNNIVLFLVVVFVSSIIIFIWFNALLFLKKKIIVVLGKIKTKIIDPSFLRKIKLCCELRFRYSFVHKLLSFNLWYCFGWFVAWIVCPMWQHDDKWLGDDDSFGLLCWNRVT